MLSRATQSFAAAQRCLRLLDLQSRADLAPRLIGSRGNATAAVASKTPTDAGKSDKKAAAAAPEAIAHPPSSVAKGTVLTGLNILAGQQDPVALADEEYPAWVWTLTDPKKKKFAPEEQFSKAYFKLERKRKQLAWNKSKAKSS